MELEEPVGQGMTSEIYAWGEGKVLKLFYSQFSLDAIHREAKISQTLNQSNLEIPVFHGYATHRERSGLVYDRIDGRDFLSVMSTDLFHLHRNMDSFVREHRKIHQVESLAEMGGQFERLSEMIHYSKETLGDLFPFVMERLQKAEEGCSLCHGDFHPGNIIVSGNRFVTIDWMNAYLGNPASDVVRTFLMLDSPFLPEEIPLLARWMIKLSKPWISRLYKRKYLKTTSIKKKDFDYWVPIMAAARLIEQIPGEEKWLLRLVKTYSSR